MLALLLLAACAAAQSPSQKELDMFRAVNALRAAAQSCGSRGVFSAAPALTWDCRLWRSARAHSADMRDRSYFSHYAPAPSPHGKTPCARSKSFGWTTGREACGENIAAGYEDASAALDGLMRSGGHCATIMDPAARLVGIGAASGGQYGAYWTQHFGEDDGLRDGACVGEAPAPSPAPAPCEDRISNCEAYGSSACSEYEAWARQNCAASCAFCGAANPAPTPVCADALSNCADYGADACAQYATWARINCPAFCMLCDSSSWARMPLRR
jgi:uncharacterized protein YkwD